MLSDRFSSLTTCSRWRHETEPGQLDQSLSCRFWKVATHPPNRLFLQISVGARRAFSKSTTICLRFFGLRRNSPIWRIDDQGCALAGMQPRLEHAVVRPANVLLGSARGPFVADAPRHCPQLVYGGPLLVGVELPVPQLRVSLERRPHAVGPETLQIRVAPHSFERGAARPSRGPRRRTEHLKSSTHPTPVGSGPLRKTPHNEPRLTRT